jgi:hypothetical protein
MIMSRGEILQSNNIDQELQIFQRHFATIYSANNSIIFYLIGIFTFVRSF